MLEIAFLDLFISKFSGGGGGGTPQTPPPACRLVPPATNFISPATWNFSDSPDDRLQDLTLTCLFIFILIRRNKHFFSTMCLLQDTLECKVDRDVEFIIGDRALNKVTLTKWSLDGCCL